MERQKFTRAVRAVERTLDVYEPATLVVERNFRRSIAPVAHRIAEHARRMAAERGIRVVRISITDASTRIAPDNDRRLECAVRVLIQRYPVLATALAPGGQIRLRDPERWRRHRALAVAFCFAHAVAVDAIVRTAR